MPSIHVNTYNTALEYAVNSLHDNTYNTALEYAVNTYNTALEYAVNTCQHIQHSTGICRQYMSTHTTQH